jgi:hypothetical protein
MTPNMKLRVQKMYNKFQIIVVWDMDFVKICKLFKILNNKDCDFMQHKTFIQGKSCKCTKDMGHIPKASSKFGCIFSTYQKIQGINVRRLISIQN